MDARLVALLRLHAAAFRGPCQIARDVNEAADLAGLLEAAVGKLDGRREPVAVAHAKMPPVSVRCPQACALTEGVMLIVAKSLPVRCHRLLSHGRSFRYGRSAL